MAAPTSYTESTLATFMLACLKDVATALGWTALSDVQEAVNEALLSYGVDTIADATDIQKLRALARREIWKQVCAATAGNYAFSADGASFSRQQVHEQALQEYGNAASDAMSYDGLSAVLTDVTFENDPYRAGYDVDRWGVS